jgi:nucleotidyltransferase/DNA polymerase involved in DNA repair
MALTALPNIGKELASKLERAGIETLDDLQECGSVEAMRKIEATTGGACLNMLYALEGAIQGIRWHGLSKEQKDRLKDNYRQSFRT